MNDTDPRAAIATRAMGRLQVAIVVFCVALNAMDGFDVLAISFAAPGIAEEWGVARDVLGIVLSMELIGMAAGSVLIGNVADRIGRRRTIIGCLAIMATGMFGAAFAADVAILSATRLFTGLGIGGMLSATSAMVAEFSSDRRRPLSTILNIAGYSLGAIIGGTFASALLAITGDWRSVFLLGGTVTALLLPLAIAFLPESVHFLIDRRPNDALPRVNRTLRRMGIAPVEALPARQPHAARPSIMSLFAPRYAALTILLTIAYFAQVMAFYYIQKWTPKIVVDLGFEQAAAGGVLVAANIGGLAGAVFLGLASTRLPLRPAIIAVMLGSFASFAVYGLGHQDLLTLSIVAAAAVFFANAGIVGLYPIMAEAFPDSLRASGTGFVIGMGRGGSALGPVVAGGLFAAGSSLFTVSLVMGVGTLLAAFMLVLLPFAQRAPVPAHN